MADGTIEYKVVVDNKGALKSIEQVGTEAEDAGKKGEKGMDGIGASIKKIAGIIAASAIVAKIADIGKAAIEAYANYEQLVGGVETLFKDSAGTVQEYAANAYKTAGMSANAYMETVTSFSASMIQSLGGDTAKAAEVSNMAITDMADNANKMGTRIEEVQRAYQSMARGNFGMLDSLKLGYGGTRAEMERMLADAEKISGIKYDISSFSDIANAIHVVQTEMGITGTTAKEAATTIQGSAASMQAAWENLLVGMVDGTADKSELIKQLFGSVKTYLSNLLPAIGQLIIGAIRSLPEILGGILDIASQLVDDLSENADTVIDNLIELLAKLVQTIIDHAPQLLMAAGKLVVALAKGLVANVGKLVSAGLEILGGLLQGIAQGGQQVLDWFAGLPDRILAALGNLGTLLLDAGRNIINGLLQGIRDAFAGVGDFVSGIGPWIAEHKGPEQYDKHLLVQQGRWIMQSLAAGLDYGRADVMETLRGISADVAGFSLNLAPGGYGASSSTTNVFVNGITASNPNVLSAGQALASEIMLDLRMG